MRGQIEEGQCAVSSLGFISNLPCTQIWALGSTYNLEVPTSKGASPLKKKEEEREEKEKKKELKAYFFLPKDQERGSPVPNHNQQ